MIKAIFSCCTVQPDNGTIDLSKQLVPVPIQTQLYPESNIQGKNIDFEND